MVSLQHALMDSKRRRPFPEPEFPMLARHLKLALLEVHWGIVSLRHPHKLLECPPPPNLVGNGSGTSAPSSATCAARRLARRRLMDNEECGQGFVTI